MKAIAQPAAVSSLPSYLAEVRAGLPLSRQMAIALLQVAEEQLGELLSSAQDIKQNFKSGYITYSRKIFIPLTTLCRDYCGYCTFRRDPGQAGAHTMSPEEV
ncbi:MAG TPA: hypothetical protein VKT29_01345, partial [Terriglobales bacterium]|nr:hypothetical protein [Terriglobales bacterium]